MPISPPIMSPHWLLQVPIAHRGLYHIPDAPENSLKAFQNAIRKGYPIELDVQILADGQLAVFHDSDLERVTGRIGKVSAQTAGTIQQLRLFGTEENVPLLSEVLALVNGSVPLLIEIKRHSLKVGDVVQTLLSHLQGYRGDFAVQSFDPWTLHYLRRYAPGIPRGQLSGASEELPIPLALKFFLLNCPFYSIGRPHFVAHALDALPHWSTNRVRASGIPLLTWTVRSAEQQAKAHRFADNYIFEDPLVQYSGA